MGPAGSVRIVVATYNIHGCVGADGRCDPDRIAAVIREIGADVIALQEVDARGGVEGGLDQFGFLARVTRMRPIAGPTLRDPRGDYGNAVLTRLAVRDARRIDLSVREREPRGALDLDLDASGQEIRVIATHLGLHWRERRAQVARLVQLARGPSRGPIVLVGDMNEWIPLGHSLRPLSRLFGTTPRRRTFPARRPLFSLDRIWCRPASALAAVRAHSTRLARVASDHLPLRAELLLDRAHRHVDHIDTSDPHESARAARIS